MGVQPPILQRGDARTIRRAKHFPGGPGQRWKRVFFLRLSLAHHHGGAETAAAQSPVIAGPMTGSDWFKAAIVARTDLGGLGKPMRRQFAHSRPARATATAPTPPTASASPSGRTIFAGGNEATARLSQPLVMRWSAPDFQAVLRLEMTSHCGRSRRQREPPVPRFALYISYTRQRGVQARRTRPGRAAPPVLARAGVERFRPAS